MFFGQLFNVFNIGIYIEFLIIVIRRYQNNDSLIIYSESADKNIDSLEIYRDRWFHSCFWGVHKTMINHLAHQKVMFFVTFFWLSQELQGQHFAEH